MKPTEDFWGFLGFGIMFFLILMGFGGCNYLLKQEIVNHLLK